MLPETNSEEKPTDAAQTEEGLGHRSGKDHSTGCSRIPGWDVWYPSTEKQAPKP